MSEMPSQGDTSAFSTMLPPQASDYPGGVLPPLAPYVPNESDPASGLVPAIPHPTAPGLPSWKSVLVWGGIGLALLYVATS